MEEMTSDKIFIRDLFLRCIIGLNDEERREKQDVNIMEISINFKRGMING